MVFKKISDDEVEETKSTKITYKISDVKAQIASAQGSIKSYQAQVKDLKELLVSLEAAVKWTTGHDYTEGKKRR